MSSILIGLGTLVLVIVCILLVLVILMQRPNANSGMGAALGGGAVESMFGGETGNILTRATVKLCILYFVISVGLFLGYEYASTATDDAAPQNLSISAVKTAAKPAAAPSADAKIPAASAKETAKEAAKAAEAVPVKAVPVEAKPVSAPAK